jgi:serine/threonine protein kinase
MWSDFSDWSNGQVKECALGIARGMAWLHECGVIHRDLKSPNLLLNTRPTGPWQKDQSSRERTPVVRITDFGLSREMVPAAAQFQDHRMTMDLKVRAQ